MSVSKNCNGVCGKKLSSPVHRLEPIAEGKFLFYIYISNITFEYLEASTQSDGDDDQFVAINLNTTGEEFPFVADEFQEGMLLDENNNELAADQFREPIGVAVDDEDDTCFLFTFCDRHGIPVTIPIRVTLFQTD